jgi:hypothetical protein
MLRRVGGDREMVDVRALAPRHDEQAVLAAEELALGPGAWRPGPMRRTSCAAW